MKRVFVFIAAWLFIFSGVSFAANKTVTVKGAGGDYTTLNAALAGEATIVGKLIDNTCILTVELYKSASPDTTPADTGTGYTANANYYLDIRSAPGEYHGGIWDNNNYTLAVAGNGFIIRTNYTRLYGIQAKMTVNDLWSYASLIDVYKNYVVIDSLILKGVITGGSSLITGLRLASDGVGETIVKNCIIYDFIQGTQANLNGIYFEGSANVTNYIYNTTLYNNRNCLWYSGDNTAVLNLVNTGFAACTINELNKAGAAIINYTTCDNNTPTFVSTSGTYDLHLDSGDTTWKDKGTDKSTIFTIDIDGGTRPTGALSWDIGADEYGASGGGGGGGSRHRLRRVIIQ